MGGNPEASLAALRKLIDLAKADPEVEAPVTLTDVLVGPERASVLRACAIPHEFNPDLLRVLWDWPSPEEADRCYDAFAELSILQSGATSLSMHDRWRKPLWKWWLRAENRSEFQRISRRLVDHFSGFLDRAGGAAALEGLLRKRMYHLIGADRDAGFVLFESLCRRARHQWRFTECSTLIRLVRDYEPILTPEQKAKLGYHEGKLEADVRNWKRAEELFRGIGADASVSAEDRFKAMVRLGQALREQQRVPEAVVVLEQTQGILAADPHLKGLEWRVLRELGEAYRDTGSVERAQTLVLSAINAARIGKEAADFAGLFNSLGTAYLKQREIPCAIKAFKRSLDELERQEDVFRPAQVQNNLGIAYTEQGDWAAAESAFAASLDLKRQAGDLLGQGIALQNMSRVQAAQERLDEATQSAEAAAKIFAAQGENRREGKTKQALGKYARKRGDTKRACALLEEAVALLEKGGDTAAAAAASQDLLIVKHSIGLPWWAWVAIAFGLLFVVALIALITLVSGSEKLG
jgi:tetratricopeptide (TPR) repeat protein